MQNRPDPVSAWQAALGRLQLEIPQEQFNIFLRPCSGLRWEDDCLVVGAATTFAVSWLELPLHLEMVREAVAKTTGAQSSVRYLAVPASDRDSTHERERAAPYSVADFFGDVRAILKAIPDPWPAWCRIRTWEAMEEVVAPRTDAGIAREWAVSTIQEREADLGFLLLAGAPGVGKTYLACAAVNAQREMGMPALYGSAPRVANDLQELLSAGSRDKLAKVERAYRNVHVLLLDDFGQKGGAPWGNEKVNEILRRRHQDFMTTVVTTNLTLAELEAVDGSVASRLLSGTVVPLIGPDIRQERRVNA